MDPGSDDLFLNWDRADGTTTEVEHYLIGGDNPDPTYQASRGDLETQKNVLGAINEGTGS